MPRPPAPSSPPGRSSTAPGSAISGSTSRAPIRIFPPSCSPPSGRAPRRARRWYFSPELVRQAGSILQDKMLFGSDFPAITPDRWLADFAALPIKDAARPKILKDNAVALLGLG